MYYLPRNTPYYPKDFDLQHHCCENLKLAYYSKTIFLLHADMCWIIGYYTLSEGISNDLRSFRLHFVSAPILGLHN